MDNTKELKQWIIDNADTLKLKVERLHWINDWFPGYSDYWVSAIINNESFEGRGIDSDDEQAFLKAFSELVERIFCFYNGINSNGVAAHYNKNAAILNARKELIERDAVLCHHLTDTPFVPIENEQVQPNFMYLKDQLIEKGIEIKLAQTKSSVKNLKVAICVAKGGKHFASFFGFGCDYNIHMAQEKAMQECLTNVIALINGCHDIENLSIKDFSEKSITTSRDHRQVHFTEKLFNLNIYKYFSGNRNSLEINDIGINNLQGPIPIFNSIPIYVVKATSNSLQNIFYGIPNEEKINYKRLTIFSGKRFKKEDVVITPHPIG